MTWHFWAAIGAGLVAASLVDWLFAGVLFHDRHQRYPEVWRTPGNNMQGIIAAQVLTIPTVIGAQILIVITSVAAQLDYALLVAAAVWMAAAAPVPIVNSIFIKLGALLVAAHTVGGLVKLLAVATSAVAML